MLRGALATLLDLKTISKCLAACADGTSDLLEVQRLAPDILVPISKCLV